MADIIASRPDFSQGTWAEQGELQQPSSDKIETGHVVERPPFQLVNWIENRQDQGILYLMQNGISSWDTKTFYPQYALATLGGVVYQALQQNTGKDPSSSTDYWVKAFYSKTDGDSLKDIVNKMINEDGFLSLYVKKSDPVMDSTAKGTGYAFKTAQTTGLFLDDSKNAVINKDGETLFTFDLIKDVENESNNKVVRMSDLKSALAKKQAFPVGSLYITTTEANPSKELGYGTWEAYSQGKVLVGKSSNGDDPNWTRTVGNTFGEFEHKLVAEEIPKHNHSYDNTYNKFTAIAGDVIKKYNYSGISNGLTPSGLDNGGTNSELMVGDFKEPYISYATSQQVGDDKAHNNVQPSIVVNIWKRVS